MRLNTFSDAPNSNGVLKFVGTYKIVYTQMAANAVIFKIPKNNCKSRFRGGRTEPQNDAK